MLEPIKNHLITPLHHYTRGAVGHLEVAHQPQRGHDAHPDDGHGNEGHRHAAVHRVALAQHELSRRPRGPWGKLSFCPATRGNYHGYHGSNHGNIMSYRHIMLC